MAYWLQHLLMLHKIKTWILSLHFGCYGENNGNQAELTSSCCILCAITHSASEVLIILYVCLWGWYVATCTRLPVGWGWGHGHPSAPTPSVLHHYHHHSCQVFVLPLYIWHELTQTTSLASNTHHVACQNPLILQSNTPSQQTTSK